jgi:alpha,alpha-trehalose phosphorylase
MLQHPSFRVEPWSLHETSLNLDRLAQSESVFALSNGHIGVRGNLDEGEPQGIPGTYLNGFYELRPLPLAESQFGVPESSQTLINVTNGKLIGLLVDDEPFDVRHGWLRAHERVLDFRAGTLTRTAEWCSPAHRTIRVKSTRLVSFTHRAILAIAYEVEPVDGRVNVVVHSDLIANEQLPSSGGDPRVAAAIDSPLVSDLHLAQAGGVLVIHHARRSGLRMAASMYNLFDGTEKLQVNTSESADWARVAAIDVLEPGQRLRLVKLVAYGWSHQRSTPALGEQVADAAQAARAAGWDTLLAEQRAYLDDFWDHADVEIEGDPELQQAIRFALFHVLSAGARAEGIAIPAKGLTGTGYDGHSFWDTDLYIVPALSHTAPVAAADAIRWRYTTLPAAKQRARDLGLAGAAFPWRTIHGEECSGYWPAGTAAFHVNADIAFSALYYVNATGDVAFERAVGLEILVETARLWRSVGYYDLDGKFCIDGVTGPDEYSCISDNNIYTNLMAKRNLLGAAAACQRHMDRARELGVAPAEIASWRAAAQAVRVPFDDKLGVHQQSEGFTRREPWNFAATRPDQYPLLLHFTYFDLYRKQVVKQPDLVLATFVCSDEFTPEQRAADFDYYERITVRDSSLSACSEATAAADAGHLRLAFDYAAEAALMDLHDFGHNTRDGLHLASLAGAWVAFIMGFGGMRAIGERLTFAPRLPDALTRLAFSIRCRGACLNVNITTHAARYRLVDGMGPLEITHHGEPLTVYRSEAIERPIPPAPDRPPPTQPPGREPRHRGPG